MPKDLTSTVSLRPRSGSAKRGVGQPETRQERGCEHKRRRLEHGDIDEKVAKHHAKEADTKRVILASYAQVVVRSLLVANALDTVMERRNQYA